MPRTATAAVAGEVHHVLNRANARARVFFGDDDYQAFVDLLRAASRRVPMDPFAACLMPNHFHLVPRPHEDSGLARWMHWPSTSHVRRHQRCHRSVGRIGQGRYKAFPVQQDEHLLTVMRYVERNALRADLVRGAEHWEWGSAAWRGQDESLLTEAPVRLPGDWLAWVNHAETEAELSALRRSAHRQAPFGAARWQQSTAERLGLEHTLRPRGRPKGGQRSGKLHVPIAPRTTRGAGAHSSLVISSEVRGLR